MRVAVYIRVSTEEQALEGYSIAGQKNELIKYAEANDYTIVNFYIEEGLSGKNTNRPNLQRLLKDAKKNEFEAVLVYKLDRFSRSVKDLYDLLDLLKENGVDFISKQEKFDTTTAIGRLFIGFLAILAQFERELIAERVRLGQEQKVREGKKPSGRYPYGYDKKGNQIPEEVEQLKMVRELYMSGLGFQGVASRMIGKLRRGYPWTASNVTLTLENPFYAGIIRYGSKLPNGKYPQRRREERVPVIKSIGDHVPIWTMDEFNAQIERMKSRSQGGYSHVHTYAFNGVLRCGRCGASMYGRMTTSKSLKDGSKMRYPYYWCSRRKDNKSCDMPMFRETHVEHLVLNKIKQIRIDQEKIENLADNSKVDDTEKEKQSLKRELDKIKARAKKWQYAFVEEIITADDLRKRMAEEAETEIRISDKLARLQPKAEFKLSKLERLEDLWETLSLHDRQEMVITVFKTITLHTDEVKPKGVKNKFFPSTVSVEYK